MAKTDTLPEEAVKESGAAEPIRQLDPERWDSFDDTWEEIGQDNGELIEFRPNLVMFGIFRGVHVIDIPEEKRVNPDDSAQANLYVFEYPDEHGKKWSMWETYQIREAFEGRDVEGKMVRIECTGERKASQGQVKTFSVKVRTNR